MRGIDLFSVTVRHTERQVSESLLETERETGRQSPLCDKQRDRQVRLGRRDTWTLATVARPRRPMLSGNSPASRTWHVHWRHHEKRGETCLTQDVLTFENRETLRAVRECAETGPL